MQLSARQEHALRSICETFLPAARGWPSAQELNIPEALAAALDFNPRAHDRAQFLQLLDFWDSRLHSLLAIAKPRHFAALSREDRERVLLSWADSSLTKRRAVFQALRKAISFLYVMLPAADAAPNPVWNKLGYPGPLGTQKPADVRPLQVIVPHRD